MKIDDQGKIAVRVKKLPLFDERFVLPSTAFEFEWVLPDQAIVEADWLSERTERKGFLTCIETYCNTNDLLAIRLSFNTGAVDFKTPFYGCNLTNQNSGDPNLEDRHLQDLQVKYVKKRLMVIERQLTLHKAAIPKGSDFRTCHLICNGDAEAFRFGKLEHSYGKLVSEEIFVDELEFYEHVIGIHGYMIDLGNSMHVIAFNFVVGELLLEDASSLLIQN